MQVVINDTIRLRAGIDFLVDASSNKAHFDKKILKRIALDKIQNRDGIKLAFNSLEEKKVIWKIKLVKNELINYFLLTFYNNYFYLIEL